MSELLKQSKDGILYFTSPQLMVYSKLRHGFFTRQGGVSAGEYESLNFRFTGTDSHENVMKNYDLAAQVLGSDVHHVARTTQKHTDNIVVVDHITDFTSVGDGVDALITNTPGVLLTGFFADCQLVMLYDHRNKVCALAHAGWRGICNEIVRKTIEKMHDVFGTSPSDLTVVVGPSICRSCFVTDDDVPQKLNQVFGDMVQEYMYREGEKWCVDLKNITYTMLLRADVLAYNIDISNMCPCCGDKKLFWSHRRNGEARGVQAGMIGLAAD